MNLLKRLKNYFTKFELALWLCSVTFITCAFLVFDRSSYLTLIASLIGVSAILLNSKGNPIGQGIMIIFSIIYAVISYGYAYYGEMITYLGMSAPMALLALISWLKNPYKNNKIQVEINTLSKLEIALAFIISAVATCAFYFILKHLGTSNLLISTFSVTTSSVAVYLTYKRSPYFSLAYTFNDLVLIVMWILASLENTAYISVVVCFIGFLANDLYCFTSLLKLRKTQTENN